MRSRVSSVRLPKATILECQRDCLETVELKMTAATYTAAFVFGLMSSELCMLLLINLVKLMDTAIWLASRGKLDSFPWSLCVVLG